MHSDPAAVRKTVRGYVMVGAALLVFTAITVAANQLHFALPIAVAIALIIAATKGSMVAVVFMHLSHEKRWLDGSLLLTVDFFHVLLSIPMFTPMDNIGTPGHATAPAE